MGLLFIKNNDVMVTDGLECNCSTALSGTFTDDCFSIPVEPSHGLECIEFERSMIVQIDSCGLSKQFSGCFFAFTKTCLYGTCNSISNRSVFFQQFIPDRMLESIHSILSDNKT